MIPLDLYVRHYYYFNPILPYISLFFFLNDPAPPEIYTLPLPDPLPICENKGFECQPTLPVCRSQRAIELALRVIATTDERANTTAGIVNHNHRALQIRHGRIPFPVLGRFVVRFERMMKIRLVLDFCELGFKRILRGVLHGRIERRVDRQPTVIDLVLR